MSGTRKLAAILVADYCYQGRTMMRRESGEPLNPSRLSVAEIDTRKARIAPHVFVSQYQQRPEAGGSGYCSIERLVRYAQAPPFELIVHSWDIASTKGGGDWTVCAKFGLAKDSDGRDILYLTGIVRMQIELPDVSEAIVGLDADEKPALIVLDGNGIGRGVLQALGQRQLKHVYPGADLERGCSDGSKLRRFNDGRAIMKILGETPISAATSIASFVMRSLIFAILSRPRSVIARRSRARAPLWIAPIWAASIAST
jgi:phage terminase large subunit-like protein